MARPKGRVVSGVREFTCEDGAALFEALGFSPIQGERLIVLPAAKRTRPKARTSSRTTKKTSRRR
jgi:hypothetical protein